MPRTITIDGVELLRLQFLNTANGGVQVCAEYHLKPGSQVFQTVHKDVTVQLTGGRKTTALAIFEAIVQDVGAAELT